MSDGELLTDEVRLALTAGNLAHLVTLEPDGSPQVSIVWVGLEDGEVVVGHLGSWQKVRNIRRDPRVALSIVTGGRNEQGLDHYLVVHGRARVTEGGTPELLQRLSSRLHRSRREVPAFRQPATAIHHPRHGGACQWCRSVEPPLMFSARWRTLAVWRPQRGAGPS